MKWQGRQRSSNIEDRRGGGNQGGGGGFGGGGFGGSGFRIPTGGRSGGGGVGGIAMIIIVVIVLFALGINPMDILTGSNSSTNSSSSSFSTPSSNANEDELVDFVGVVIKETEDLWTAKFREIGESYPKPKVVLFSGSTNSGCGQADAATGPFYCPNDQKVYIDLSFYEQLRRQFGAPGDFAQAYVLAHEVGHHVQNVDGTLPEFNRQRARMSQTEANAYSVRVELQADCYAGVWANYIGEENLLDDGDIDEAITAANAIGDDTLQKQMQGYAVPKTFTHGTSAQRKSWFSKGYQTGNPGDCDTFSGSI